MTTPIDLLQSQVTQDQAFTALKGWILSAPNPPEAVTLDTPGTPENAFLYGLSLAEENRSEDRAAYALAGFRSTAPLAWLRLIALDTYGLPVQVAGFATTIESYTNTSGNQFGPFAPGELRLVHKTSKAIYENTTTVTIPPAQLSPSLIPASGTFGVRAIEPGTASNAAIGDISRLETPLEGVEVENQQAAITNDDESRESINRRIDAAIGAAGVAGADSLSTGGPATAVEAIALNGRDRGGGCLRDDGSRVTVTRTKLVRDDTTGESTLYVGDDDGPLDPGDLAVVAGEVIWYAERVCSTVNVANVDVLPIIVQASITVRKAKITDSAIQAAVVAGFPAAELAVPIGGFEIAPDNAVPVEYIEGAIRGAAAGQWQTVTIEVTLPPFDVLMPPSAIAKFILAQLDVTRIP